jgi:hypothetical protein
VPPLYIQTTIAEGFEKHKLLMKENLLIISEKSHTFWYDKYEKALKEYTNIRSILEFQEAFFDTLEILGLNKYLLFCKYSNGEHFNLNVKNVIDSIEKILR